MGNDDRKPQRSYRNMHNALPWAAAKSYTWSKLFHPQQAVDPKKTRQSFDSSNIFPRPAQLLANQMVAPD